MVISLGKSVRVVAIFEFVKGMLVLAAGFGALAFLHRDAHALATELVGHFHLNPEHRYVDIFLRAAAQVTDKTLWLWAGFAAAYATFRFVEGYGLWYERPWAEWLALLSGGIYLPVEIYELVHKVTWVRISVLVANIAVVALMAAVLWRRRRGVRK